VRGSIACPVAALVAWRDAATSRRASVLLDPGGRQDRRTAVPQSVADIVKAHAENVGLNPAAFAGHSLWAGCQWPFHGRDTS
jgi:hypothetical protein